MTIIPKKLAFIMPHPSQSSANHHLSRIIFLLIFLIGVLQIIVGVGFLFTCRSALQPVSCAFFLKAHPCNGLQAPGYGGIMNIAISTFGLSCLGPTPASILFLIVSFAEFLAGLQFLCAQPIFFKDYFQIPTADDVCKNHNLKPEKLSLCWRNLQSMYPNCANHTNRVQIACYELTVDYITSRSNGVDFTASNDPCAIIINEHISLVYTRMRHLSGITILFLDILCILLVFFLIFLNHKQKKIKEINKIFERTGVLANSSDKIILKHVNSDSDDSHQETTIPRQATF